MKKLKLPPLPQILNISLRMMTLVTKVALMLYMGRYLSLEDMGMYGLVFGAVMIATDVIGVRFDYVVSRDIVGATPEIALCKMRDQAVFYGLNYLVVFLLASVLWGVELSQAIPAKALFYILVLGVVESYASAVHVNVVSLGRPLIANVIFFIRAALWAIVAITLGLASKEMRVVDTVFVCWFLGVLASLGSALFLWRHMPWKVLCHTPINWAWIREGVQKSWLIWLGTIGLTAGTYIDRFIVVEFLGLSYTGVSTFYSSFSSSVQTLIVSGVLSFAYPRLISLHREDNQAGFWREVRRTMRSVSLWATCLTIGLAIGVPLLGWLSKKPMILHQTPTLILLLIGSWIRANADGLYYVLFAQHKDRPIWLGNLLYLIPAFGFNALLVPLIGFPGIGFGSIIASLLLLVWRWRYIRFPKGWRGLFLVRCGKLEALNQDSAA